MDPEPTPLPRWRIFLSGKPASAVLPVCKTVTQ
ncbi:mgtA regulatory leader peptide MgtL [Salmonella enterica subsp. enterica serovar Kentucky]|nr:mgtA regulatory leader peptide MgtL [Salmonella enterica subsp. enterica serovar Kentucky]